ncbi:MAG TPA: hypothetical protein VMF30_15940 [Pirellulales bacterium]|nr:hypothetical protein [Pirellulales bacterium]
MQKLWTWLVELDRILRGEATRVADLKEGTLRIPLGGITFVLVLLGAIYGLCMAVFAEITAGYHWQLLSSAIKVPALFLLTLLVTLPSLYVFNALVGSRLTVALLVRLFVASLGVNLAVLASLGPIVAFFAVSTTSYPFMVLLNVLIFAVSGVLGMSFLLQTLHRLNIAPRYEPPRFDRRLPTQLAPEAGETPAGRDDLVTETAQPAVAAGEEGPPPLPGASGVDSGVAPVEGGTTPILGVPPGASGAPPVETMADEERGPLDAIEGEPPGQQTRLVFDLWMIVFGLVGAQMSWVLRPFIGSPHDKFQWLRPRESNFFEAVFQALRHLFF